MDTPTEDSSPLETPPQESSPDSPATAQPASEPITESVPHNPLTPGEALAKIAEAAKAQRLPPAEEDRAAGLLQELLKGGKAGIASAVAAMLPLPWMVCVTAVSAVWPELSLPMKRLLVSSLAKSEGEQARRLRLSVARAVFKLEPAAGLKIAAAAAADLRDPETGALSQRNRQLFFHVFIGKGKPWLLQLPLGELKAAEADALVHAAIESFPLCPPLSQLSILRWVHGAGRFKKISEADLATVVKAVGRWNVRLQQQLRAEIPELPDAIAAVLKPVPAAKGEGGEADQTSSRPAGEAAKPSQRAERAQKAEKVETAESLEAASRAEPAEGVEAADADAQPGEPTGGEAPATESAAPEMAEAPQALPSLQESRRERERREKERGQKGQREPEKGRKPFDFKESLRGLEVYVANLRNELEQTKVQLRRREEELKRGGRPSRSERAPERPAVDVEALFKHNAQLETTVEELRQQLQDLASHHEAVAESRRLHGDEPLPEGGAEALKALLSIKLQESFETYHAMRLDPLDRVFRLDYRDLLGSVFDVLLHEGVPLVEKKAEK